MTFTDREGTHGAEQARRRELGRHILAACGRALEHDHSAAALLKISDLVDRYERGEFNRSYLLLRLEGVR